MDSDTRNAIERATQKARKLLEADYAAQLDGRFDVHRNGVVAVAPGAHLSPRECAQRERIVAAIEHKRSAGLSAANAVADYLRDAAFTTLNRYAALKMLEARELARECITKGEQSAGYKEFCGMAPGLALLPDSEGFRIYIECLFDELSTEVKVLFDRRDPSSVLWPKRKTFEDLLEILNASELGKVWGEDETIGWVYQYFNGQDERRAMRDESQAPRNSRELAVRNQFFTPRYVVQFLTDNTLGRIWYEMRHGDTALRERCEYMVRRPKEVFLRDEGSVHENDRWVERVLSGDFTAIPEDFRWDMSVRFAHLLDGYALSEAFGLGELGDSANTRSAEAVTTGRWEGSAIELWLCLFYEHRRFRHFGTDPDREALAHLDALCRTLRERLIAEDPSAPTTYIAPRAKKDPRDLKVLDPACGSGHFLLYAFDLLAVMYLEAHSDMFPPTSIVTGRTLADDYPALDALKKALPGLILSHNLHGVDIDARCAQIAQIAQVALWMRAQRAFREAGVHRADRPVIRRSNIVIAEPLVSDATMMKEFLATLGDDRVKEVFTDLVETLTLAGDLGLLLRVEQLVTQVTKAKQSGLLFAPPEGTIRAAIADFVRASEALATTRRRLFADDAAQGVGLLETAEKKFDVVLMNPPFGAGSTRAKKDFEKAYPRTKNDIYAAFVERGIELLASNGRLGAITSRTGFFLPTFQKWREEILLQDAPPIICADIGLGVMDAAMVEASAYCLEKSNSTRTCTRFIRVLEEQHDKQGALERELANPWTDNGTTRFSVDPSVFKAIPRSPFAYWAGDAMRRMYRDHPALESESTVVCSGPDTGLDFRCIRTGWECRERDATAPDRWRLHAKGGAFSPFYLDVSLCLLWGFEGNELLAIPSANIRNAERYFRPAITWTLRTKRDLSFRPMPVGCIFGHKGPAILVEGDDSNHLLVLLALGSSKAFRSLVEFQLAAADAKKGGAARSYEVGVIQTTPVPDLTEDDLGWLARIARLAWSLKRSLDTTNETSHAFILPHGPNERVTGLDPVAIDSALDQIQREIDDRAFTLYGIGPEDRLAIENASKRSATAETAAEEDDDEAEETRTAEAIVPVLPGVSWLVGVAFGRFDKRLATGERAVPPEPEPFDPLPARSPGMWPADEARRAAPPSILVDDAGHGHDIVTHVTEACAGTGVELPHELRAWLAREFFPLHIKMYSKSRRKAPIYWQFATPSARYSIWLYLHAFSMDTLARVQNDYAAPKLAHEERRRDTMRHEYGDRATAVQRRELAAQDSFVDELRGLVDEVKRVAPLWNPDLDDGVILNFAPLWRLVPQNKAWQKELKATWDTLCEGTYDWAHLAMHFWPERVVPKCATDRSLAIAHGLEDVFWVEGSNGKWSARKTPTRPVGDIVHERTSPAVKAALRSLMEAPSAVGVGQRTRRGGAGA